MDCDGHSLPVPGQDPRVEHTSEQEHETHPQSAAAVYVTEEHWFCSLCLLPPSIFLQILPVAPFPGFTGQPLLSTNNLGTTQFSWCQPHSTSPPLLQGSVLYQRVAWKTIQSSAVLSFNYGLLRASSISSSISIFFL